MESYQYVEDAVAKETAALQALREAKERETELLNSGKLVRIVRNKTIILTTYPQKYEDGTQD